MRFVFPVSTSAIAAVTVVSAASLLLVRRLKNKKNKEKLKKPLHNERPVKPILTDENTDPEMAPPRSSTGKSKKRRRKRNYSSPRPSLEEAESLPEVPVIPVPPIEEAKSPYLIRALRDIHQKLTNIAQSLSLRVRQWTILSDTEWSISDEEQAGEAEELSEPEDLITVEEKNEPEDDESLIAVSSPSVSDSKPTSKAQLESAASAETTSYDNQKPSTSAPRRTWSDLEESWSECITGSTEGSESDEVFHDAETSEVPVPFKEHPKISVVSVVEEKNDIKKAAEEIRTREEKLLSKFEEVLQLQQTKVWESDKESSPDIPVFDWERELVMELERLSNGKAKQVETPDSPLKSPEVAHKEETKSFVGVKALKELEKIEEKVEIPEAQLTKIQAVEEEEVRTEVFTNVLEKEIVDSFPSQKIVPEERQMLIETEDVIQISNSVSNRGVEEVIEEEPEESEEDLPLICLDSESESNTRESSSPLSDVVFEQHKPVLDVGDEKSNLADLEDDPDYKELIDQDYDRSLEQLESKISGTKTAADNYIERFNANKLKESVDIADKRSKEVMSENKMDVKTTEVSESVDKNINLWSEDVINQAIGQAAKLITDKVMEIDEKQNSESLTELFSQELAKRILVESFSEAAFQTRSSEGSGSSDFDGRTCRFQDFVTKMSEEIARIAVAETVAAAKLRKEITIHQHEKEFGTRIVDEIFNQIFNKTLLIERESKKIVTDLEELPLEDQITDVEEKPFGDQKKGSTELSSSDQKKDSENVSSQNKKISKKEKVTKPDTEEKPSIKGNDVVSWLHKRTDSLLLQEKPVRQFHAMKKQSLSQIPKPVSSTVRGIGSPQQQRRVSEPPQPKKRLSLQSNQQSSAGTSATRRQSAPVKQIQPPSRSTETAKKPVAKPERTKSILKTRSVDVVSQPVNKPYSQQRRSLQVTPRDRKHEVYGMPLPSHMELNQSKPKQNTQPIVRPSPQSTASPPIARRRADSKAIQPSKTMLTKVQAKPKAAQQPLRRSTEAFVTLATNDVYSLGALVLGRSLRASKTTRHLVILTTEGISAYMRHMLSKVFDVVINVTRLEFTGAALDLLERPELGVTLTKLHCWKLTQYKKCVFLDADSMILQNCDELFERSELSAVPDVGWPDCFNSGVFVFIPSLDTYWGLVNLFKEKGSFDGGDQGLLNWYFGTNWKSDISRRLPFTYNLVSTSSYTYTPAFNHFGSGTKIVHFLGATKPWQVYWSTESRYIIEDSKVNRTMLPYMQKWLNIFFDEVFPQLPKAYKDRLHCKHSASVKDITSKSSTMDTNISTPQSSPNISRSPHTISASPSQTEHIQKQEHISEVIHHYEPPSEQFHSQPSKETDNQPIPFSVASSEVSVTDNQPISFSVTSSEVSVTDNLEIKNESVISRSHSQRSSISGVSTSSSQQLESVFTDNTNFTREYREESSRLSSEQIDERQDSSVDYSSSLFQEDDLEEVEEPETEEVRQAAWEEYKMDYLGKDRFDNILKHLETMMGFEPSEKESVDQNVDEESEKYEYESNISDSDSSHQNTGNIQNPEPSYAVGDYKRMHDWEQGRIDYAGQDSSDNIMRRLDFLICNDNPYIDSTPNEK